MTYCASVITPTPKRRKSGTKRRKLRPKNSTGVAFEAISNFRHGACRSALNKEMNVIGHDLLHANYQLKLERFLGEKFTKAECYGVHQNRPSIFRTPDKVKFQTEDCSSAFRVPLMNHVHTLAIRQISMQLKSTFQRTAIPPSAKAAGPLA